MTVTGRVETRNATVPGEQPRPIVDARVEVWWKKQRDGVTEWLPLREGPGDTGEPVTGRLNGNGEFTVDFIYPQDYELEDGSTWYGCAPTVPFVPYLRSHACADEDVQLRVYGEDAEGRAVRVMDASGGVALVGEVPLGRFFERTDTHSYPVDTPAGHVYRGAYNVIDLVGSQPDATDINGIIRVQFGAASEYRDGIAYVEEDDASSDVPEHEIGHKYYADLLDDAVNFVDCPNPKYFGDVTTKRCAWSEGFADWIAAAARNGPGRFDNPRVYLPGAYVDLETCAEVTVNDGGTTRTPCSSGEEVEGRVAGALNDLYDPELSETFETHTDLVSESFDQIVAVVASTKAFTFEEFWTGWRDERPAVKDDDERTMFLNTLLHTGFVDSVKTGGAGSWSEEVCGSSRVCVNGRYFRSNSGAEDSPEFRWDIKNALSRGPGAKYDIWVHIPLDDRAEERDQLARYRVRTASSGDLTVVLNQGARAGWVRLHEGGLDLVGDHLHLTNGFEGGELAADGVMIVPHRN
ncbi:hypothetical protein ACTG9Q_15735 [Actinokineospora sp. 24-640]